MKKRQLFFTLLLITALSFYSAKAQYTKVYDFMGGAAFTGSNPQYDQNLISDGTYLYGMTYTGGVNNQGTVFKIKINDNTYTKILDFSTVTNGSTPLGSLISDGTYLYGLAFGGGSTGAGTAFKIKISDNSFTKILDFNWTNGGNPYGSFISDGTYLYGTTRTGGTNNGGTVFKIKISDNSYTKIFDFAWTPGAYPQGSLISDGTYLYGMTHDGGINGVGTAFKIKISDNSFTKILDFESAANGANPMSSLVSDGIYLYGMAQNGGTNSAGTAFKIKISDNTYTKMLDFTGSNGIYPYGSLVSDGPYLYGMTHDGGTFGVGTTFKINISDNSYTKILDFTGTTNGSRPFGSLISDGTYLYSMTQTGGTNNLGTVFKIKISDNSYIKILDFGGNAPNGSSPNGSIISDGTYLYGMAQTGGTNNLGTAFKIKISDNTYTKILDFAGTANGSYPNGSLFSDGTFLYGMTYGGGINNVGTIFKLKIIDNSYTKILDFAGAANGSNPYGSLISDGTYLYGMTRVGGTNNLGTVFKIKISDNAYTKILDFVGTLNGSYPTGSLISDGAYLYGLTSNGGTSGYGTSFKIKISDNSYTKIFDFTGIANGIGPYGSLVSDGTYLYGMTQQGGTNNMGNTFKIKISDNTFTKTFDFAVAANGGYPLGSLISDGTYLYGITPNRGTNDMGTLFKLKISDNTFTKLMDFAGATSGSNPSYTQLIINGSFLYGMTPNGGISNLGTVYKYQIYYPEINVKQGVANILDNTGTFDFGSVDAGTPQTITFTVENLGIDALHITGTPKVVVSGTGFTLASDAPATINATGAATFQVTFTPNAGGAFNGTISIDNDDADENPYNFAITGTGVKLDQAISFSALSTKTYGDAPFTVSATGGGSGNPVFFTSQDNTIATCTGTNGETITILKAGTVKIYANQAGNASYNEAAQAEQTLTINAMPITVTANTSQSKVYGNTDPAFTYGVSPALVSGDAFSGSLSRATGEGVGSYSIIQGTLDAGSNYSITFVGDNFAVTAKTLSIDGVTAGNKEYDGTISAILTGGSLTGVINSDVVDLNAGTGSFLDANVGTGKTVTASNYTISGKGAVNYSVAQPTGLTADITAATPTITWNNPVDIKSGTALSATQLNATANVPGTFVYTPASGTVLSVGAIQDLKADFTPTDATNYNTASKTVQINVTQSTGFVELAENSVSIFPNPASNIVSISGLSAFASSKNIQMLVVDIHGKTMLSKTIKNTSEKEMLDISSLAKGIYFVHLQTDTERIVKRIVKE